MNKIKQIIDLIIRGTTYRVACDQDSSNDLLRLSKKFSNLVQNTSVTNDYNGSDAKIFLIAALQLEDKLEEITLENDSLKRKIAEDAILIKKKERLEQLMEDSKIYIIGRIEKVLNYIEEKVDSNVDC